MHRGAWWAIESQGWTRLKQHSIASLFKFKQYEFNECGRKCNIQLKLQIIIMIAVTH